MKNFSYAILGATCAFLLACSDSDSSGASTEGGEVSITDKTISGVSQKGPFVKGSSVTVYELGAQSLSQTGKSYDGKIKNERGEFTVEVEKLGSPYALLKADGYYRNEITGEKSNGTVTLYAMTDLSNRSEVNVNLLTHLEYERSLYLVKNEKMSVAEAKKQAEKEVLESFGIEGDFENSENLNIFGDDAGSAALLAISVLMQGDLKEADFTERLNDYASDIEDDGKWDDKKTATLIADWAANWSLWGILGGIRQNIARWELSSAVPAFEKFIDEYWWQNYGLGKCTDKREGEVLQNNNSKSQKYNTYFICNENAWRLTTDIEKDTYKWKNGKDGDVKNGDVVKENCYVFEDSAWRSGYVSDCALELRGCTKNRQDTVGLGKDKVWYVCDAQTWREATDIEKDTATWGAGKNDGEIRTGQVNKGTYYIYDADKKTWRKATTKEKDTYDWKDSTDGSIKKGNVTDTIYVFDVKVWRVADEVESLLGGCFAAIQDSIGVVGNTYYICKPRKWTIATEIQYDTYKQKCTEFGQIVHGNVHSEYAYFCYGSVWKRFYGNESISYGRLLDERDGQIYRTVQIGNQTWMAENLAYADSINYPSMLGRHWCGEEGDRDLYGCYYTWSATIDSVYWSKRGNVCGFLFSEEDLEITTVCNLPDTVQGICPDGWHVPADKEWEVLTELTDRKAKKILAKELWKNATDELGLSILPAGYYSSRASNDHTLALFWTSTDDSDWEAMEFYVSTNEAHVNSNDLRKYAGKSVRCIKDEDE